MAEEDNKIAKSKLKDRYFRHDFGAWNNPKITDIRIDYGFAGVGIYWSILEVLYSNDGYIYEKELRGIRHNFGLRDNEKVIFDEVLENVFKKEKYEETTRYFSSECLRRIEEREAKSDKCRQAANTRYIGKEKRDKTLRPEWYEQYELDLKKEVVSEEKKIGRRMTKEERAEYAKCARSTEAVFGKQNE